MNDVSHPDENDARTIVDTGDVRHLHGCQEPDCERCARTGEDLLRRPSTDEDMQPVLRIVREVRDRRAPETGAAL